MKRSKKYVPDTLLHDKSTEQFINFCYSFMDTNNIPLYSNKEIGIMAMDSPIGLAKIFSSKEYIKDLEEMCNDINKEMNK